MFVGGVVIASLWSVARFVVEGRDTPARADVQAAAAAIQARPDDVVLVAPPWSFAALQQLGRPGLRLIPTDGPWDVLHRRRHRRVLLWREPDAAPWLAGREHPVLQAPPSSHGAIDVAVVDDTPARFDLLRSDAMQVSVVDSGAACTERSRGINGGVRCAGQPRFVRVAREWAQVTENSQEVVVVQPAVGGLRLVVEGVEIGETLVVAAGHTRNALARLPGGKGSVEIAVFVDDVRVGVLTRRPAFVVEPHRAGLVDTFVGERDLHGGFQAEVFDTRAVQGVNRRLSFVVTSDHAEGNAIGLDAFVPG